MFGHEKGAFTGALSQKRGRFERADTGTIFLDEIGELPIGLQVKLLRALQEKVVIRVGETKPEAVDIRVIAATNIDLRERIQKGKFREDLFFHLNVVPLHIPPLREHHEDVPELLTYYTDYFV